MLLLGNSTTLSYTFSSIETIKISTMYQCDMRNIDMICILCVFCVMSLYRWQYCSRNSRDGSIHALEANITCWRILLPALNNIEGGGKLFSVVFDWKPFVLNFGLRQIYVTPVL